MNALRIPGPILILGAFVCFWMSREPLEVSWICADETDDIETKIQINQWGRDPKAGKRLVALGRAEGDQQKKTAWIWIGGGAAGLFLAPRFTKPPTA
jgi:hypothetical protein